MLPSGGEAHLAKLRTRLTYSNVISTLALLVAVGGGTALAVNHINAAKVDGLNAARLDFERPITVGPNPKFKRVFDQGGLLIRARCGDLSGFFMDVQARTRVDNAEIQAVTTGSSNEQDEAIDRNFDKADSLDVPLGAAFAGRGDADLLDARGLARLARLPGRHGRAQPGQPEGLPARRHRAARARLTYSGA